MNTYLTSLTWLFLLVYIKFIVFYSYIPNQFNSIVIWELQFNNKSYRKIAVRHPSLAKMPFQMKAFAFSTYGSNMLHIHLYDEDVF